MMFLHDYLLVCEISKVRTLAYISGFFELSMSVKNTNISDTLEICKSHKDITLIFVCPPLFVRCLKCAYHTKMNVDIT